MTRHRFNFEENACVFRGTLAFLFHHIQYRHFYVVTTHIINTKRYSPVCETVPSYFKLRSATWPESKVIRPMSGVAEHHVI